MSLVRANGLEFHVVESGSGPPVMLLHGFTGSSDSWIQIMEALAGKHRVIAIDLIGHGNSASPLDEKRYEFLRAVDDLSEIANRLGIERVVWVGYSMGGRLALALALHHPQLVSGLVLESATAGLSEASDRLARQSADRALAEQIEADGVAAFVANWERLPLWQSQSNLALSIRERQRRIRLGQSAHGLANSLRGMGQGAQPSFWHRLSEIEVPTLLIAGDRDAKYAGIAKQLSTAIPNADVAVIPGAGHAVHLETPSEYVASVNQFVSRLDTAAAFSR